MLREYMRSRPPALSANAGNLVGRSFLPGWSLAGFIAERMFCVMAMLLLSVSVCLRAADAVEESLPGDRLYGLKMYVAEPLRTHTYHGAAEKAAWEELRVERRLNELDRLAAIQRLDPPSREELVSSIDDSVRETSVQLLQLTGSGERRIASDILAHLEGTLAVHRSAMAEAAEKTQRSDLLPLLDTLQSRHMLLSPSSGSGTHMEKSYASGGTIAHLDSQTHPYPASFTGASLSFQRSSLVLPLAGSGSVGSGSQENSQNASLLSHSGSSDQTK